MRWPSRESRRPRRGQRGAALVVGLVLMLILTILGISGMNTATLELTMTANSQARQLAFQAAESGIEITLTGAIDPNVAHARATHTFGDGSYAVDTEIRCVGMTPVPTAARGDSIDARALHFEVSAVGRGPRNAESRLTQGFYLVVPAETPPDPDAAEPAVSDCFTASECPDLGCDLSHEPLVPVRTYWRQDDIDD